MPEISPDQAKELLIEIVNKQKTVRITRLKTLVEIITDHVNKLEKDNRNLKRSNRRYYKRVKRQQRALARLNQKEAEK